MSDTTTQKQVSSSLEMAPAFGVTRRKVLKGFLALLAAIGLGNVVYALYRFWTPGEGAEAAVEIPLGEIPEGGAIPFKYGAAPGILLRGEDGSLKALSLVCTHLACTVSWNAEKKEFYCPCHEGFFDAEGKVISGPPPASLERWKVEVRGEKAVIGA